MKHRKILIIQGHPDSGSSHLCRSLAGAYAEAARSEGHEVRVVDVATLDFPILRSQLDWEHGALPEALAPAQEGLSWCEHLVLFFPLWMGDMPALLKAFIEQVARPGFAFASEGESPFAQRMLKGRSARVVVTMGMPAVVYRWFFSAHGVKAVERNILGFVGFAPVHRTLVGNAGGMTRAQARSWMARMVTLGRKAA